MYGQYRVLGYVAATYRATAQQRASEQAGLADCALVAWLPRHARADDALRKHGRGIDATSTNLLAHRAEYQRLKVAVDASQHFDGQPSTIYREVDEYDDY